MKFSVIMSMYNGAQYIEETINSILAQTYKDFEVIIVNDSSTDNSLEIVERYAKNDPRIRVFPKANEGTSAKSVKYGLQFVSGDYMMYSSQDDLYSSDLLQKAYDKIIETQAYAVVPDMLQYWSEENKSKGTIGVKGNRDIVLSGRDAFILSLNWIIHGFVMWKMETVKRVGWYDYGLNSDEYTTRMLYFNSNKIVFSDGIFYYRQGNPNAITKKWNFKLFDYLETNLKLESFLIENNFSQREIEINRAKFVEELININLIFNAARKSISKGEKKLFRKKIDSIFKDYKYLLSNIEGKKFRLITRNKYIFNLYCKLFIIKLSCIKE